MEPQKELGNTAKALAKNPLGIIALFIVLIYGVAALVLSASSHLVQEERTPIVWFLVTFPVIVLGVFGWLVSCHYEKLYAPRDFDSDESFLKALKDKKESRAGLTELDSQIESKIKAVLSSEDFHLLEKNNANLHQMLDNAADKITKEIRNSAFITIDARKLTGSDDDVYELPVSAFSSLGDLTDQIYFCIDKYVGPFEYGYSWVVRNPANGEIIKNSRMISGTKPGVPISDNRPLTEVGISAGTVLEVVLPK